LTSGSISKDIDSRHYLTCIHSKILFILKLIEPQT